ncbi:MAG TPA: DUF4238 domain-containing protein [Solirubrobacterales bacterium]|nr:DUF4238 domain-containing protein [Solirubrobacterales bacterium]
MKAARAKAASAHHRLPQFYLRAFTGRNGRIDLLDPGTGSRRSVSPRNAFAETGYYTVRDVDLEPIALMEVLFEDFENHAARVYRFLVNGGSPADLDVKARSYFAFLMAAQITRGNSFRDFDKEAAETLGKQVLQVGAAHSEEWWDLFMAEMKASGEDLPEVSREQYVEFIERDEYTLGHSPEHLTEAMLSPIKDLAEIFFEFDWHTVHFEKPSLLTAEEPISYWRPPSPSLMFRGIGPLTSDEVRLPLTPKVALVLTHPRLGFGDRAGSGGQKAAARLNYLTWSFRPNQPLVLCPDTAHHPLPGPVEYHGIDHLRPFTPGPIIDR